MENKKVQYFSLPELYREQENLYLEVRRREGRVQPDDVLKYLPDISDSNPYAREWKWRKRSFGRFLKYLPKNSNLRILDLGCGNGWMANQLAQNPNWDVWAADLNKAELEQGARLFGRDNLRFIYADVLRGDLPESDFDVIVLAASAQYFPRLQALLIALRKLLNTNGEIHLFDSPFYKNEAKQAAARQRTSAYYTKVGMPEMAAFYHHHLWQEAEKLGAENLNGTLKIRLLQKLKWLAPFGWLRFKA